MKELQYPFDSSFLLQKRKKLKRILLDDCTNRIPKRIAVLGGSTTNDIVSILELFLLENGISPTFYQSEYAQYWQDAMFDTPKLLEFQPDIIFIHTTLKNITEAPLSIDSTRQEVEDAFARQLQLFTQMWDHLRDTYHCPIIQNNFEFPSIRLLGNRDAWDFHGMVWFVQELNRSFGQYASSHSDFYIHDIQYLSASYGLDKWHDDSYWYLYKYAMTLQAIPQFSYSISRIICSIFGKNKKVLALDLDNTLWGGIIGDDGLEGISIGNETAEAEAYTAVQKCCKAYKQIGVLLTICSKNEPENAKLGFTHPDSILNETDFVAMKINWEPKDQNLLQIADELSLLPESFVFVDDNPAERDIVSNQITGISVPEFDSPISCIRVIDHAGYFEVTTLSDADSKRSDMYRANIQRTELRQKYKNYTEYLLDLQMRAEITDFTPVALPRIVQLTNKSNQFNLTTKRYTQSEMEQIFHNDAYIRLFGRLQDKFGDNGIVSVVIGEIQEDALHIDLWIMSCRVLKRDMELAMLDTLVDAAKKHNIHTIYGYYYKTAKNAMVQDLYNTFGFTKIKEFENGDGFWKLDVAAYHPLNCVIDVNRKGVTVK